MLVTHALNRNRKKIQTTFVSPVKNTDKKERKGKRKQEVGDDLRVCVLNILPEVSTMPSLVVINLVKEEL